MLTKTVTIGEQEVTFKSSAAIPRLYRIKFKRDIFKDLAKLESSYKGKNEDGTEIQIEDLEIFENVAYIMAYHADSQQVKVMHGQADFQTAEQEQRCGYFAGAGLPFFLDWISVTRLVPQSSRI